MVKLNKLIKPKLMKFIIVINILLIILFSIYYFITIGYNLNFKQSFGYFSQKNSINNKLTSNQLKLLYEIRERVKKSDEYLNNLSKSLKKRNDSKLIYPNVLMGMTSIKINHMNCSEEFGRDLLLVVLIFTRVDAFDRRQLIRETWGQDIKSDPRSRLYFATGLSRDPMVEKELREENEKFNDILQFGYYENYFNCTMKATALLRWTAISCPFVKFMLKVDDDSLVLPKNLLKFCEETEPDSIYGWLCAKPYSDVIRDPLKFKWYITIEDYPDEYYPDYMAGSYLIPGGYTPLLYETAVNECLPAFPLEDVYITGIVAEKAGVKRSRLSTILITDKECHPVINLDYCYYENYTIIEEGFNNETLREVWKIYKNGEFCQSKGVLRCWEVPK